mgnify:CR=1 FL=1
MRRCLEMGFHSWDGSVLHSRHWPASSPGNAALKNNADSLQLDSRRKALVFFHDGAEHSGRLQTMVDGVNLPTFEIFAFDFRGHGKTTGPRGWAPSVVHVLKDIEEYVRWIDVEHGILQEDIAIVAVGEGAALATAWVHDYAPRVRSQVLLAPAFKVKLRFPWMPWSLKVFAKFKPDASILNCRSSSALTHSSEEARKFEADPLIVRRIAVDFMSDMANTSRRVVKDAQALMTPTLILAAGRDRVVDLKIQKRFFEALGSTLKKIHVFPKFFHGLAFESDKSQVYAMIREFVLESFAKNLSYTRPDLKAEGTDFSNREYRSLLESMGPFSSLAFGLIRMAMNTIGRLSRGIKLGWESGFDSGVSLDYVYRNRATGSFVLGKIFDRLYLNSLNWSGIRERKINLQQTLHAAIQTLHLRGEKVRILDVAAGPGRYVMEAIKDNPEVSIQARLCDYKDENLREGRELAKAFQLDQVSFEKCDALDLKSYKNLPWQPNLVIVSGLLELIPDNLRARKLIAGVSHCLASGGIVIYTGLPWHPHMHFIGRVLKNREGHFWIMRRRSLYELDQLFAQAGFRKRTQLNDEKAVHTVAIAEKFGTDQRQRRGVDLANVTGSTTVSSELL